MARSRWASLWKLPTARAELESKNPEPTWAALLSTHSLFVVSLQYHILKDKETHAKAMISGTGSENLSYRYMAFLWLL